MLCEINFQNMNTYLCYQLKEIHDSSKKNFSPFLSIGIFNNPAIDPLSSKTWSPQQERVLFWPKFYTL